LKAKDEELLKKTEDIIILKSKLQEHEIAQPFLTNELTAIKSRLSDVEKELQSKRQQLFDLEPRLHHLEPLASRLMAENAELQQRTHSLENEVYQLRAMAQLVTNVNQEIEELDFILSNQKSVQQYGGNTVTTPLKSAQKQQHRRSNSVSKSRHVRILKEGEEGDLMEQLSSSNPPIPDSPYANSPGAPPPPPAQEKDEGNYLTAAQRHAQWIGLPAIRQLNSKLYDKLRLILQDLYVLENQHKALVLDTDLHQKEQSLLSTKLEEKWLLLDQSHANLLENYTTLQQNYHSLERDYLEAKEYQYYFQQIRKILEAYPLVTNTGSSGSLSASLGLGSTNRGSNKVTVDLVSHSFYYSPKSLRPV
jgi:hypothetical protein